MGFNIFHETSPVVRQFRRKNKKMPDGILRGFNHITVFFTSIAVVVSFLEHGLVFDETDGIPDMKRRHWQSKQFVLDVNDPDLLRGVRTSPEGILPVRNYHICNIGSATRAMIQHDIKSIREILAAIIIENVRPVASSGGCPGNIIICPQTVYGQQVWQRCLYFVLRD